MTNDPNNDSTELAQLRAKLADLHIKYWIISDDVLYIKRGAATTTASAFYAHTDPAGTWHWALDHSTVSQKTFNALGEGWSSEAVPPAIDHADNAS